MKITRRQRSFLRDLLVLNGTMQEFRGRWFFNGDEMMPMRRGPVCDSLIAADLLENLGPAIIPLIRPTSLAKRLLCRAPGCYRGRVLDFDSCDDLGACQTCDGTGVLLEVSP